jgi:hypothetical protein
MSWKKIIKEEEEEELPIDVKRARERIKQGLPSKEYPLIPQFEDTKMNKADSITDMAFVRGQIKQDLDTIREMVDDSNSLQDLEEMEGLVADFVMKLNKEYGR